MSSLSAQTVSYKDTSLSIPERIQALLKEMTVEEKAGQLNQLNGGVFTGPSANDPGQQAKIERVKAGKVGAFLNVIGTDDIIALQKIAVEQSRLGIPLLFGFDVIHGYRTIFPIPLAEACAWNPELAERTAEIAADEASAAGLHWTFGPNGDVSRDPRWGRVMEAAGEDAWLSGEITAARIRGFQKNLAEKQGLMATLKHFAVYGAIENGREYGHVDVSRFMLFNFHLRSFERAIQEKPASVMNAFNVFEGIPVSGNAFLNVDILQKKWGFNGFMLSDWNSFGEMIAHGYAEDRKDAAKKALLGGSMMDMFSEVIVDFAPELVKSGEVPLAVLDSAVAKVLYWKFKLDLFENPYAFGSKEREMQISLSVEHRKVAREAAQQSIVLLKNENNALPLISSKKIALIGELAAEKKHALDFWIGKGSPFETVTLLEGLKNSQLSVEFAQGYSLEENDSVDLKKNAIRLAKKSDVILVAIGLSGLMSGEDRSLTNPVIPRNQVELLKELKKLGKPIIAIVFSGRPLILTDIMPNVDALLYGWILGTEAGNALADVLSGEVNPSGKLVYSFPRSVGQIPIYYNSFNTGRPIPEGDATWTSRFRDEQNEPLFPFGFGLSYTRFDYSDIKVSVNEFKTHETTQLNATITNTGKTNGYEIVQLYIRDVAASVIRPVKELKGFQKVWLKSGESKNISFEIGAEQLGFYTSDGTYTVEPGKFQLGIGKDSEHIDWQEAMLKK